jgi:hypothetical protein
MDRGVDSGHQVRNCHDHGPLSREKKSDPRGGGVATRRRTETGPDFSGSRAPREKFPIFDSHVPGQRFQLIRSGLDGHRFLAQAVKLPA